MTPHGVSANRFWLAAWVVVGLVLMLKPMPPGSWADAWFDGTDKLVHLVFFAVLWCLGVRARLASGKVLAAGLLLLGVGVEAAQAAQAAFTTTRSASLADVLADAAGLLLGVALARWALRGQPEKHGG